MQQKFDQLNVGLIAISKNIFRNVGWLTASACAIVQ